MTNSAGESAHQARNVVPTTQLERIEPDLEGVTLLFWRTHAHGVTRGFDPEAAWRIAVSGDTAARMAGTPLEDECNATAELLTRAAAYGWWPKRLDGDYVAVPLAQWVAEGHPFTPKVPSAEAMLDRWGIQSVVVDSVAHRHPSDARGGR